MRRLCPPLAFALVLVLAPIALAPVALADEPSSESQVSESVFDTPSWMPEWLTGEMLLNPLWRWALALIVLGLTMLVLRLLVAFAAGRLARMSEETRAGLKDMPLEIVSKTKAIFYLGIGVWLASLFLHLPSSLHRVLGIIVTMVVFLQAGIWVVHAARELILRSLHKRAKEKGETVFAGLIGTITTIVVWTLVGIVALDNLDVNVTGFVAAFGIAGIAVGMAVKDVLSDIFSSISIALDKPFQVGDYIVIGDYMGTVERIGLKTSRLRSLSGEQLVFSNSDLLSSRIRNYKRMKDRRAVFSFGVVYGTPAEKLEAIPGWVQEAIESKKHTRFDRAHFTGFGESSLDFEAVFYMQVPDFARYRDVQQQINIALYRKFEQEGVEFAFPTQTIHVESAGEEIVAVKGLAPREVATKKKPVRRKTSRRGPSSGS